MRYIFRRPTFQHEYGMINYNFRPMFHRCGTIYMSQVVFMNKSGLTSCTLQVNLTDLTIVPECIQHIRQYGMAQLGVYREVCRNCWQ